MGGHHGTGLAVFEPATLNFPYHRLTTNGLDVSSFAEDTDGRLWVGTEGDGLFCREPTGQWRHFGLIDGVPSDYASNIVPLPVRRGQKYIPVNLVEQNIVDFTPSTSRVRVGESVSFTTPESQLLTCQNVQLV